MRNELMIATVLIATLTALTPQVSQADMYTEVNFSGSINPGNANVKAPFTGNGFTQGQPFFGSFVFDDQLVPGSGSGFDNIFFSSFPDVANIPPATLFSISFGTLNFTAADNLSSALLSPGIQYNNGQFNGLEFVTDFSFQSNEYQFRIDGPKITVQLLTGGVPSGSSLINATITAGNGNLTGATPFVPSSVPLPSTLGLLAAGLAAMGLPFIRRRRPEALCAATA